jgi:outer membrane protein assembly factor BamD (BamD/ComL family)
VSRLLRHVARPLAFAVALGVAPGLASIGAPTPAFADTTPTAEARARALYNEGVAAFDKGDYKLAIEKYLAANETWPRPNFLYNIAQAYRLAGDKQQALRYYRSFLDATPNAPYAPNARQRVAELEGELASEEAARAASQPTIPSPASAAAAVEVPHSQPLIEPVDDSSPPVYETWWFWTAVGGAAVITTVVIVVAGGSHAATPPPTTLGTTSVF